MYQYKLIIKRDNENIGGGMGNIVFFIIVFCSFYLLQVPFTMFIERIVGEGMAHKTMVIIAIIAALAVMSFSHGSGDSGDSATAGTCRYCD